MISSLKLFLQSPRWGRTTVLRQSSQFSGVIDNHQWTPFPDSRCDFLICSDIELLPKSLLDLGRAKRVFVMHENPSIWRPSASFLEAIGIVISPFRFEVPQHIKFIQAHSGIPWFYGIPFRTDCGLVHEPGRSHHDLDSLGRHDPFTKRESISMIVSGKAGLFGHQWRLEVANALKEIGGTCVDFYGFGHNALPDKAAALDEYRFSVVIENTPSSFYWTEKLADCLLGGAMPIYSGADRAKIDLEYELPELNFASDPLDTAKKILDIASAGSWSHDDIKRLRDKILYQHNFLSWIPQLLIKHA